MPRKSINLFMWGFQQHFRIRVEVLMKDVLKRIGATEEVRVLLVGLRTDPAHPGHPVCLEPEDGPWDLTPFEDLPEVTEAACVAHPDQNLFYGDQRAMDAKPEWIRSKVLVAELQNRLAGLPDAERWRSFFAPVRIVDGYRVATVVQLPQDLFVQHPDVEADWGRGPYRTSFLVSCIEAVLEETALRLQLPDPGATMHVELASAADLIRRAANTFMKTPFLGRHLGFGLFDAVDELSKTRYEGDNGVGRLYLVGQDADLDRVLTLETAVALSDARWARKLLQMSSGEVGLLSTHEAIFGVGNPASETASGIFAIEFIDHHEWALRRGDDVFLRVRFGEARLPRDVVPNDRFLDNALRLFAGLTHDQALELRRLFDTLAARPKGALLVIAADAAEEARRLSVQGMSIQPASLTDALLSSAADIDGAILASPDGVCHAIGVILDGPADPACSPSRGGRFNSAVRYVNSAPQRMAFVFSDDQTADVVPFLRPRASRARLEEAITALEVATLEDYHAPRSFVVDNAFYFDGAQCERINAALDRIAKLPREAAEIVLVTSPLSPHPDRTEEYLTD